MDALLDECVMVEEELVQFSQELGLRVVDVPAAARGEDDLCADKGVPTVVRQGRVRQRGGRALRPRTRGRLGARTTSGLSQDNPRTASGQLQDNLRTTTGQPQDNLRTTSGQPQPGTQAPVATQTGLGER